MTLSAKAQDIERNLQIARAKANYITFPDLARRYVKHNKDGAVLANSALLEMALAEAEAKTRQALHWTYLSALNDTPGNIATSPRIKPELVHEAVERLEKALPKGPEDHQEHLQNIRLPPPKIPSGYNFVLVISGLAIKGMVLEEEGRTPEAIVSYDHVAALVQSNPNEKGEELFSWTERALYRASLLKLREGDQLAAIRSFRAYHNQALLWPSNFRLARRVTLYRYFSQTLSSSFKTHGYQVSASGASLAADGQQSQVYPSTLSLEMAQIHSSWEGALYAITTFPRANEKNWRVALMIERIVEDRKLLGPGNEADRRALVEIIYRATQKTFQSPRIMRFLFFALAEWGRYDEAELALKAYLDMVEIHDKVKEASTDESFTQEQLIRLDIESKYDSATVMIAGSRLYGKELDKPDDALKYASVALDTIQKHLQQHEQVKELLHDAYKYQGIAYGLQATKTHEPEQRPGLFSKAVESLAKAIQAFPVAFEGHYHLALQLAEMREIPKAILAAKQSLSINPSHIPSWHLLTLLLSSQKDYEKALGICAVGLKESPWDQGQTEDISTLDADGEEYLSLCITQAILQDQVHGPESALEHQSALFSLYSRVFAADPSNMSESLYDLQSVRRHNQSTSDLSTAPAASVVTGRPRAGSTLSVKSRNGGAPDIGLAPNGSYTNGSSLDVPKPNYAPSIASSIGSTHSRFRRAHHPPTTATGNPQSPLSRSVLGMPLPEQRPTTKSVMRTARANKVLVTLWLLSASTFRRLGKMEDSLKAIEEAERVDASNPDVWYQLGLLYAAQNDPATASVSFSKALALVPYHPACSARVGRSYLDAGSLDMAEGILETTTKSLGWDSPEAWFYLGKVFEGTGRLTRAKECLWYALELENSRPIRSFSTSVARYL
ncbi:hypothetical protein BGX31_009317 [Mortierella sp. GBA43]|nr:hypothetical protein BGX31_009317 [Mortierella sp. GBA43]